MDRVEQMCITSYEGASHLHQILAHHDGGGYVGGDEVAQRGARLTTHARSTPRTRPRRNRRAQTQRDSLRQRRVRRAGGSRGGEPEREVADDLRAGGEQLRARVHRRAVLPQHGTEELREHRVNGLNLLLLL